MIASILLFLDFVLLGVVFYFYLRRSFRERNKLQGQATESLELQQKVYQIQVLQEIGERIGYSLDTDKIIEIITSSIGNLLEYDTVSVMMFQGVEAAFKCHVENTVNHHFIGEVKEQMLRSVSAICGQKAESVKLDERITGNILDDNLKVKPQSYVNVPVIISGRLLALINVASANPNLYKKAEAVVLYTITNQAATAVAKLHTVLENEKGKLSAIILSMTDGIFTVDLNNRLVVYNPAVKSILEFSGDKPLSMFDIIDGLAGKVDLRTKIEEALLKNIPVFIPELYLRDKAVELTITPVFDQSGEKLGVSIVMHDVTSEKSLEKLRQEFTAMMVHELRAPLTAVRWSSESLMKGFGDGAATDATKMKDSIGTIAVAATNMLELVNDLLDVAKIEAGKFELNIQDYDLASVITEQIKAFRPGAEGKHLGLNYTGPEKFVIKCDRVRVSQVLSNLLSNAVKYSDSGQVDVNLTVDGSGKRAVVAIKDTGIGVSQEDLSRLFSKFKQLTSSDRSRKGTGLGLVVSKGIVEAHGGQIWAESAGENLGTTFYFSLPM